MTNPEFTLRPGLHHVAGRTYLVGDGIVRMVRVNGTPSRSIVAKLDSAGLRVTGNGRGHEAAIHALATGQGTQVETQYSRCHRTLTDAESVARGYGDECAKAVA